MKPDNSLVDRAARRALQARDNGLPDLLLEGIPFRPSLWHIVVEPLAPRTMSDGGIQVVDISQEAESWQVTVGRVLACGPQAFAGRTTSGIDLANFLPDCNRPDELIGQHVIYTRHVGMELRLRKTDQVVKVMKLTDLVGVTDDPYAWKFYI